MTSTTQSNDLERLSTTILEMSEALKASERRYARIAGIVRWGALGLVSIVALAAVFLSDVIGTARAQGEKVTQDTKAVVEALNTLNSNLAVFGMLSKTLQDESMQGVLGQFPAAIAHGIARGLEGRLDEPKTFTKETWMQYYAKFMQDLHLGEECGALPEEKRQECAQQYMPLYLAGNAAATLVDAAVLVQRLRQDSDQLRETGLKGVTKQLSLINGALSSVPPMAANMEIMNRQIDLMNRNMASMTHSMGSSMGRMGNWMPW